jgi:hypothetical protein
MNKPVLNMDPPAALSSPQVRLNGPINDAMHAVFLDALNGVADGPEPVVCELTTIGGDADTARRMASDIRLFRERTGRSLLFLGQTIVYSAGMTVMSAFPVQDRWLARETTLLIHCRRLTSTLQLDEGLFLARRRVVQLLADIDAGLKAQQEDFARLIEGADIGPDELLEKARHNWYLSAAEALERRLIGGVI